MLMLSEPKSAKGVMLLANWRLLIPPNCAKEKKVDDSTTVSITYCTERIGSLRFLTEGLYACTNWVHLDGTMKLGQV